MELIWDITEEVESYYHYKSYSNENFILFIGIVCARLDNNQHIIVWFQINFTPDNTIGQMQRFNQKDKEYYINYINDILSLNSD
jgi:hypothetical protein